MRSFYAILAFSVMLSIRTISCPCAFAKGEGINARTGKEFAELAGEDVSLKAGDAGSCSIDKKLRFKVKTNSNWSQTSLLEYDLDESGDFSVETSMTQVYSDNQRAYGLVIGVKSEEERLTSGIYFLVDGNNYHTVYRFEDGKKVPITKGWKQCSAQNTGNSSNNKLKLQKRGDKMLFSVNSTLVATCEAVPLDGDFFGIYCAGPSIIAVNNFYINIIK